MRWIRDAWFRMRALLGRARMEREMEEEFAFHLEREAEKYEAEGLSPAEARRLARVRFGGVERHKEAAREAWGVGLLTDLSADLRYALRQLRRNPGFSTLAVVTLALGIGGTVALGSVAWGVLLRPLPVEDEGALVVFWSEYNWRGVEFDHVRNGLRAFDGLAAWSNDGFSLRIDRESSLMTATVASAELFDVLGARPFLGRTFRAGDDRPGAEPVMVLSHGLWTRDFGADPAVVGRRVLLDGEPTTVVGVMPEGFFFPDPRMEAWVPLNLDPDDAGYQGNGWLVLTGRLADGVTDEGVEEELARITAALGERFTYPDSWDKTRNAYVTPLRTYLLGDARPAVLLLLGAVGILLLMACANVAALVLTRAGDRTGEMGVRAALGAGRARLARQLLTESIVLSSLGAALGTGLAAALFDVLVSRLPLGGGLNATLSLDTGALAAATALAVAVGALVALAPIRGLLGERRLAGTGVGPRGSRGPGRAGARVQGILVFVEVLLAVVLVAGAALLVRSVDQLRAVDPGLDPEGVLAVDVYIGPSETSPQERRAFFEQVLERARALPGVDHAGLINRVPIRDAGYQGTIPIADRPDLQGPAEPNVAFRTVTAELFDALDVELVEGRGIEAGDREGAAPVAVVNETLARRMWPGESALGRRIGCNIAEGWFEVVGVVRNVAVHDLVSEAPMAAYYSRAQTDGSAPGAFLVLEAEVPPATLAPAVRRMVGETDARAAVGRVQTMEEVVEAGMAENLRLRFFLLLFASLGLILGSVGVYGVVAHTVEGRRAELGIRLAIGARPARLLGRMVGVGMVPVLAGVVAGLGVALAASRTLSGVLFRVAPTDPVSLLGAGAVLLAVGAAASLVPAWRASRTDPVESLRAE